ncbi:MAG: hypothetical protein HY912_07035 [Desulfomonile tiedjei]|uniref:Uncharacterized protein n=1 Tax=Desulfomonile tiedjei TaxID=2358 RepID=A0A9D6UZE2_9BACT|nr:hypothetical protein [Desulfomonile tiedjei]
MSNLSFATNELKDAAFSLHMVAECLTKVKDDSHYWKWVIIALHNALQGFMVSALCNGNDFPVIQAAGPRTFECPACSQKTELPNHSWWGSLEDWLDWFKDHSRPVPKPVKLLSFMDLYKRIKKQTYMGCQGGKRFRPRGSQNQSVKRIHEMRNSFIHFTPKFLYSTGLDYLPIVRDVAEVVSFIAFESGNILWYGPDGIPSNSKRLIAEILTMASELDKYYTEESKTKRKPDPELESWAADLMRDD